MTIAPLAFVSEGLTLQGALHLPDRLPAPFVVGCHGLFADKESPKQQALAAACCEKGLAFFRFDHRGCGTSDGDFAAATSLEARCQDLKDAVQAVAGHSQTLGPAGLFGSSMGGAVVLASARQWPGIRIVTVAAPLESEPVAAAVQLSDNPAAGSLPPSFYDRALRFNLAEAVAGLSDVLLFHGKQDAVVPVEHARKIYNLCADPKELVLFEGGDHRISTEADQAVFVKKAVHWLARG
ncbi:MAG: alpha/beta fold hydrolase [Thermodesulfobacteriota bacterium]|nr:alpha/beta fold hydrolase [Thermodesulfobacteriota bacterium]